LFRHKHKKFSIKLGLCSCCKRSLQ